MLLKEHYEIRSLRLRMGWSQADLGRRTHCTPEMIQSFESGEAQVPDSFWNELEILFNQADICRDELQLTPHAENIMDQKELAQINLNLVKVQMQNNQLKQDNENSLSQNL